MRDWQIVVDDGHVLEKDVTRYTVILMVVGLILVCLVILIQISLDELEIDLNTRAHNQIWR